MFDLIFFFLACDFVMLSFASRQLKVFKNDRLLKRRSSNVNHDLQEQNKIKTNKADYPDYMSQTKFIEIKY